MGLGANNTVTLQLRDISLLFSRTDNSPLAEREVDAAAAELITSRCRGRLSGQKLILAIVLAHSSTGEELGGVEGALRRCFAARADLKRGELAQLMQRGRLSLCSGSVFLAICLLLGGLVSGFGSNAAIAIVREGLTICGWVAMWKPLEIFLYDWWPLLEDRRRLDRLSRMQVQITPKGPPATFDGKWDGGGDGAERIAA